MSEIAMKPLIREITEGMNIETIAGFQELEKIDRSTLIDLFVMSASYIGFEVQRKLHRIKTICPEALLMCISIHELTPYVCWKFVKNGVEIMYTNIDTETEYLRVKAAIQKKRPYYPEGLRKAIENNELCELRGFDIISEKERLALALTVKGYPIKDIAARMRIREATVSKMRTNAYTKTGLRSLPELISLAMRFNLQYQEEDENAV
jgi:DNA-binding NarL/FixJ family response regulator